MALPTAYLTTTKNAEALFNAIRAAKAPAKFTQRFMEDLGFKSTTDRLYINVFKALGLLSSASLVLLTSMHLRFPEYRQM
jgi:hypothetical protein